ncbi:MAG: Uma2 family endonuclease [Phycisphaerae bacterium]
MILRLPSKRLTARQFERDYARVPCCELVRGEVIRLSPGELSHSGSSGNAYFLIQTWAKSSGRGRAFTNETGLVTTRAPDTVRGADVAYFSYQRLPKKRTPRGFSTIPPELVVEVVGKGQGWSDMVEKAGEYLRMGVDRVWVLDPRKRSLHVFSAGAEPVRLSGRDLVRDAAILPGFSARVAAFFEA